MDDYFATIDLIIGDYRTLRKINPTHKLLSLLEDLDDMGFTRTVVFKRKYSKYEKGHKTPVGKASATLRAYYQEIDREVTGGLINLLREQGEKTEEEIWKCLEEKGLAGATRVHLTHNEISLKNFLKNKAH